MCVATRVLRCATLALLLLTTTRLPAASPASALVRRDCYFRETLVAIDDWEAILAHWETQGPEAKRTPLFPVPEDGRAVSWPNPIPRWLLPFEEAEMQFQVRVSADKPQFRRTLSDDNTEWRAVAANGPVLGYKHPGGGGKDQWYHHYERRFDRLTTFRPQPAPFALQFDTTWAPRPGRNEISAGLRNVAEKPLTLNVRLCLFQRPPPTDGSDPGKPDAEDRPRKGDVVERELLKRTVALASGETATLPLAVELSTPGGGLLVLTIDEAGRSYWIPLLTHVEDVPAVLRSIEQILADTPDKSAGEKLARLQVRAAKGVFASGPAWRELFIEASELREQLLLARIEFDRLLFVKRKPFFSEQPYMDAHHCYNRPGGGIYCLSPVRPDGKVTPVADSLGRGIYRDVCLHWDATRILFSFGNGSDRPRPLPGESLGEIAPGQNYNLYEIGVDGRGLRQVTSNPKNDCEPFYLPNGKIGFTSDRSEQTVMCGSDIHVASLFTMNLDGTAIRQLGFNVFNEFNPSVLPDGRIIYNRWEYNERSVTSLHNLFTIRPDGTHCAPYYGNATFRPNVIMFPRAVPGTRKVLALFTGHHGQTHGPIALIDTSRGVDGPAPVTVLTPGVPVIGEKIEDSRRGWYSDPRPLSETTYLCSFTPTVLPWLEKSWGLYVGDRHGNLALVHRDPEISCAEPLPLVPQPRPAILPQDVAGVVRLRSPGEHPPPEFSRIRLQPTAAQLQNAEATLLLANVYRGLPGVPQGTAKHLRILEDVPRQGVPRGGVICTSGTKIYTVKRILGIVPIEADGSAHFTVPANRNLYFEALDENHLEIQRMRSVVCLKPNERRTCIGCHEPRTQTPPSRPGVAFHRPPDRPSPPPWGTATLSFLRDVQPLLNDRCVRCHTHDRPANRVILTDDLTDQFTVAYEELLPYLNVANAMRWDNPDDVYPRPPYTYGSKASPLMKLLLSGHHDGSLSDDERERLATWIDANAVYYDRYETYTNNRHIFTGGIDQEMRAVYAKRCANCHGHKGDGRNGTWWRSVNRRDVKLSRALQAPLARTAGGWQRCNRVVFANTDDPDYQRLLTTLKDLRDGLARQPRADLLSLRGTAAERQQVTLPAPPEKQLASKTDPAGRDSVYLSDLAWRSARAGWTRNKDGLPRRDKDVEDNPLQLGNRRYQKGIGTHAPSEIVYRLDKRYERFTAAVAGAEANGTVTFEVYGDDKRLYQSKVLHGLREVEKIDVSVAGVRRLKLVVTDAGDGYICDMANWADARLTKAKVKSRK